MADGGAPLGKLQGLFEWSMKYQRGDGDNNEAADPAAREAAIRRAAAEFTPERRAFLEKALAEFTRDHAQRMREIKEALDAGQKEEEGAGAAPAAAAAAAAAGDDDAKAAAAEAAAAPAAAAAAAAAPPPPATTTAASLNEKEELLDELHDIVENIDHARDLVKIGGLPTLLRLLRAPHASLRWRAADVLAASAANNPPVQRWLLGAGALPPLMALLELSAEAAAFPEDSPADLVRARTKAVHALSALVRHYDGGFCRFRQLGGLGQLARLDGLPAAAAAGPEGGKEEADDDDDDGGGRQLAQLRRRLLRKELELLRYALERAPADCEAAAQGGLAERAAAAADLGDAELRAAALSVLLELAQHPQAWRELRERCPGLAERLQQQASSSAGKGGGAGDDDDDAGEAAAAALARDLAARLGPGAAAPTAVKPARNDHIELDPQDHGSGATHKTIPLQKKNGGGGGGDSGKPAAAELKPMLSLGAPPPPPA